ncbi:VCBS domain-containing protein [Novosphingobium bradum]|uniref:VCBS domain-containing protein n=1 Tax=Novosphingobium bradum TaxID=1737444 RepID=A0ABV7IUF6_9SPHN
MASANAERPENRESDSGESGGRNPGVTFSNSSAAANLTRSLTEGDGPGAYLVTFDVLKASGGGAKARVWSVDDGTKGDDNAPVAVNKAFAAYNTGLLWQDAVGAVETSNAGARFWITASGEVKYDASALAPQINALALGEVFTDTIQYTIRLANGTLSVGRLTVNIAGTNDAPVITSAVQAGTVQEDTALQATGQITASDADHGATAAFSGNATGAYGSFAVDPVTGKWTYTLDNAHHQELAAGEVHTETFTVTVTDDHGATATQDITITVVGTDDLAVIQPGGNSGAVTEDGPGTAQGNVQSTDIDSPADQWVAASHSGGAHYGTFAVGADGQWTYVLDQANAAVDALNDGESLTDQFTVATADGQTVTVAIAINGHSDVLPDPNDHDDLGDPGNNRIVDHDASATIYGGAGNDSIYGNNGEDLLYGGSGNDLLDGGAGFDTLYGGSGDDRLIGKEMHDLLIGGSGNDTITSGLGLGADRIAYLSLDDGADVITDFVHGGLQADLIDLSAIDADSGTAGDQAFAWSGTVATAHGVWFEYVAGASNPDGSLGATFVHLDATGDALADLSIQLVGNVGLTAADFIL